MLQPHLGRPQHVAGRVKAQGHAVMSQAFAVGQGLQMDVLAQSRTQDAFTGGCCQVVLIATAGMVTVGMGDDRALNRTPGVDVEIPARTVQAFRAGNDKIHAITGAMGLSGRGDGGIRSSIGFGWRGACPL
ncbi:hypothetical protein ALO79_200067 [Pseudomonas syringae pv. castaneae]|uniref:Ribosome association toxin RatA n=1 Tax=Pseudomonas syringae pv. castaneae TaxID=264450 RepID=A0A0P9MVJ1_PSESX|nr:hypothetical protein ALO79_200067 [Pseudomonas syringae pv. castaneae]